MIRVAINFVDGGYQEYTESLRIIDSLNQLRSRGFEGKELIDTLLTDDWGPPPSIVSLTGTLEDGTRVDERIAYR